MSLICKMSRNLWLIFVKKIGKFWEVADFKGIVTNGLNKKMIDFGAFLAGFRLKMPLFLWF